MVGISTVSGEGNEKDYHIREYREYLEKEFAEIFTKAEVTEIGEAIPQRLQKILPLCGWVS